ncbi:hypothetical protein AGDE_14030 [Angomonas deanei]|uniref:Uncharacterized protein n=1 Tax=Angomonas deanei TaxID=59799 RepID=A0A7G2CUD1_9TRYP|nr:hypothetical protein AGDE_14030 [Angomonas deanei]CAD2222909.1 hypothetical protein, conserved [Angomonas deanei]|eukprot:EPY21510.1 hypothetical protein AGDE_14030 [Angomonas deanei]
MSHNTSHVDVNTSQHSATRGSGWTTPPSCSRSRFASSERKRGSISRRPPAAHIQDETTDSCRSHSVCTTAAATPRDDDLSSSLLLEEYEREAEAMSHEELEAAVENLRTGVTVLKNKVEFTKNQVNEFGEGVKESYNEREQQQENTVNLLMKQLAKVKRRRAKLISELSLVEKEREGREKKLESTKVSINKVTSHIEKEESQIAERLRHQLSYFQTQRQQLSRVLAEQSSTVQDLEKLLDEMPEHKRSASTASSSLTHEESGSAVLAEQGPHDIARYLSQEIEAVEEMREEMMERATLYAKKREDLERNLQQEMRRRDEVSRRRRTLQQELDASKQVVAEASVALATVDEMESERAFNAALQTGSSQSSTNPTPRMSLTNLHSSSSTHHASLGEPFPRVQDALLVPHPSKYAAGSVSSTVPSSSQHTPRNLTSTSPGEDNVRCSSIKVQDTSRMEPPRPLSAASTPKRAPTLPDSNMEMPVLSLRETRSQSDSSDRKD